MNILKRILELLRYDKWNLTDNIISSSDIVFNQFPDFLEKYNIQGPFVCIRNFNHSCIYLKQENLDNFLSNRNFYNKKKKLINLSRLIYHIVDEDCYSQVARNAVPPYITIKQVVICKIDNYNIYIERMIEIQKSDELFKDLMNLQIIKDNYHLK